MSLGMSTFAIIPSSNCSLTITETWASNAVLSNCPMSRDFPFHFLWLIFHFNQCFDKFWIPPKQDNRRVWKEGRLRYCTQSSCLRGHHKVTLALIEVELLWILQPNMPECCIGFIEQCIKWKPKFITLNSFLCLYGFITKKTFSKSLIVCIF